MPALSRTRIDSRSLLHTAADSRDVFRTVSQTSAERGRAVASALASVSDGVSDVAAAVCIRQATPPLAKERGARPVLSSRSPWTTMSGLFPRWIGWLGVIAGGLVICGGILGAAAAGSTGGFHDLGEQLSDLPTLGFWIWIIATSVVLFRSARPRQERAIADQSAV
jgi:hypothetical protein